MTYSKTKTALGYYKAEPVPSEEELEAFYKKIYYSNDDQVTKTYAETYSEEEIRYKENRADLIVKILSDNLETGQNAPSFVDIGAGEGFLMAAAAKRGWQAMGVDYQREPLEKFNPQIASSFLAQSPTTFIDQAIDQQKRFDIIGLQNVLEHVIDPSTLIENLKQILAPNGMLFIQIPNDESQIQGLAQSQDLIDRDYWFSPPLHLSYFNKTTLEVFLADRALRIVDSFSDFPIEMYLWGSESNYTKDQSLGKRAHQARLSLDGMIASHGLEKAAAFYRAAHQVGIGRNQAVVVVPAD